MCHTSCSFNAARICIFSREVLCDYFYCFADESFAAPLLFWQQKKFFFAQPKKSRTRSIKKFLHFLLAALAKFVRVFGSQNAFLCIRYIIFATLEKPPKPAAVCRQIIHLCIDYIISVTWQRRLYILFLAWNARLLHSFSSPWPTSHSFHGQGLF